MPAESYVLGKDGKLYLFAYAGRLFSATGASPEYDTIAKITTGLTLNTGYAIYGNCRDVTVTLDSETVEITSRESEGFKSEVTTTKSATIEFEAKWKKGDTFFNWLRDAWANSAEIAAIAYDGPFATTGNSGLIGNFTVPGFSRSEPIGDIMRSNIRMVGSSYNKWVTTAT
jgi:hypothetical protein